MLESIINEIIWHILGLDDKRGAAVTTHLTFQSRVTLLGALSDAFIDDTVAKTNLDGCCQKLDTIRQQRNAIVHSDWITTRRAIADVAAARKTSRHKISTSISRYPSSEIAKMAKPAYFVFLEL